VTRVFVLAVALCAAPVFAQEPVPPAAEPTITKDQLDGIIQLLASRPILSDVVLQQRSANIAAELKKLKSKMVDLAVPDSPAFTVLGLSPEEVARPTTARKLAASLMNGVDRNGVLQSGVAIDTLPYLALAGEKLTLDTYRDVRTTNNGAGVPFTERHNHYPIRFLARTQVSFATSRATDAQAGPTKAALGIRFTIADFGDPRTDAQLDACVGQALALPAPPSKVFPLLPDTLSPEEFMQWQMDADAAKTEMDAYEARKADWGARHLEQIDVCRQEASKRAWNSTRWIAAYAPVGISSTGGLDDLQSNGAGMWTTFGYGFEGFPVLEDAAQLLLHARVRNSETVADAADKTKQMTQDSRLFGVQLRAGGPDSTIAGEAIFERVTPAAGTAKSNRRYSLGYERRLASNLWLGIAVGSGDNPNATSNRSGGFLLSSFKWGFAEGPSLGAGQ